MGGVTGRVHWVYLTFMAPQALRSYPITTAKTQLIAKARNKQIRIEHTCCFI